MAERLEHHAVPLGELEQLIELLREGIGIQFYVIHLSIDSWTPEHERLMVRRQKDLAYSALRSVRVFGPTNTRPPTTAPPLTGMVP